MQLRLAHLLSLAAFLWVTASEATTYYVRNGGNDSADGRSHATAWASLNKVNNYSFAPGDQVLLYEGNRWVGQIKVDWPGTSSAPAVLGAYYLDGSTPKRGYRDTPPTIDGEDRLPGSAYDPLVAVAADRVRVENLRVMNSRGRGIGVSNAADVEVVGCSVSNIYKGGIHFLKSPRGRAENNFVTVAGLANKYDGSPWGAAIEIVQTNSAVVRNNVVSETWGEGINAHSGSQYTLIEHNYLFGVRAVGIYSDAAPDTTIRRNIVVGTANSAWWRSAGTVGAGIVLNNEAYHFPVGGGSQSVSVQSKRAKIYGNLVAFTNTGIALWGNQLPETAFEEVLIYNNTLVDNTFQIGFSNKPKPGAKFVNNILLSLSGGTRDVDGSNSLNGMIAKNNYFSQGDPGGGFSHPDNRYTGLKLAKMSGWRAVTSRTQITWRDFAVASGSPVIGAGDDEPWRTATTEHDYRLDFHKAEHRLPMDMGALTFATPAGPRPMPPTNLSGT